MSQDTWMITGKHSRLPVVLAPGFDDTDKKARFDAVNRLDLAIVGFPGGYPRWYAAIVRLGRWWYAVCMGVCAAVLLALGDLTLLTALYRVAVAVVVGSGLAVSSAAVMTLAAKASSRVRGGSPEAIVTSLEPVARIADSESRSRIRKILAQRPELEDVVRDLAWRSACGDSTAFAEIGRLWAEADPQRAAADTGLTREVAMTITHAKAKRARDAV